jgi:hypothetical protein
MDAGWSREVLGLGGRLGLVQTRRLLHCRPSSLRQQWAICMPTIVVLVEGWPELERLLAS